MNTVNKILLINLAFIGDVVLSTALTRALREHYPNAQIDFMTIPLAAGISCLNPYINNVITYDKRGKHRNIWELSKLIWHLRSQKYDLAVSTNFAPRGAMLAKLAGIPCRVGYKAQHGQWFLTHAADAARTVIQHEAENQLLVLKPLGITTNDTSLILKVDPLDLQRIHSVLKRNSKKPLVVLCPFGSYWKKSWTISSYAQLIAELSKQADCCLIGGGKEAEQLQVINERSGGKAQVFGGTLSLGEIAALLKIADLLITVDTGPLHIAQGVGTKVLALFGPTDPAVWGPRGKKDIVLQSEEDCSPCWGKTDCQENTCMQQLTAERVIATAQQMLVDRDERV